MIKQFCDICGKEMGLTIGEEYKYRLKKKRYFLPGDSYWEKACAHPECVTQFCEMIAAKMDGGAHE